MLNNVSYRTTYPSIQQKTVSSVQNNPKKEIAFGVDPGFIKEASSILAQGGCIAGIFMLMKKGGIDFHINLAKKIKPLRKYIEWKTSKSNWINGKIDK